MKVDLLEATPNPEELVCRAARGDYSPDWVGSERPFDEIMEPVDGENIDEKVATLVDHLMRSGHYGPFEHPQATFAIEGVSRACMAQLTRHRLASFDVMSMRYVNLSEVESFEERFSHPPSFSSEEVVSREGQENIELPPEDRIELANEVYRICHDAYSQLVDAGIPKEDARMVLPIGTKVNLTFSMNSRAIMHFLDMRHKADAQWEIRGLSQRVLEECKKWMPNTFQWYDEHRPNKLTP